LRRSAPLTREALADLIRGEHRNSGLPELRAGVAEVGYTRLPLHSA
jgi:hypothetical protein